MSKIKLPPYGRDVRIAAQFGAGEAFDTALDNCARAWPQPDPKHMGEWKQLQAGLRNLAQSMQPSLHQPEGDELIQAMLDHPAPTLHALAAFCLPYGWSTRRQKLLPRLENASASIQDCLVQALTSLPASDRAALAQHWIKSGNPGQLVLGLHISPVEPLPDALECLRTLRPVERHELGEAVITRLGTLAKREPEAVQKELNRWASHPVAGDAFLISRSLTRQPLRADLSASLGILDTLLLHHPKPEQDGQYIVATLRALAREHGTAVIQNQLEKWRQSPSQAVRSLAAKAMRRVSQG